MEPFSIATGCISLLSTIAAASIKIRAFVVGYRDARPDMAAVSQELESLELCLEALQADSSKISYPTGLKAHIMAKLSDCDDVVLDIGKLLKDFRRASLIQKVQWATAGSKQADKLRARLESHKSTLEITLILTSMVMISSVKDDTNVIKDYVAELPAIQRNISWIKSVMIEFSLMRSQLADLERSGWNGHFVMQRFLSESASYAESIADFESNENREEDFNLSDQEADLHASPLITATRTPGPACKGTVAELEPFSFPSDSWSSFALGPLVERYLSVHPENVSTTFASEETEIRLTYSPPTSNQESLAEELTEGNIASWSSGNPLDWPFSAATTILKRSVDKASIRASLVARTALSHKEKIALDVRLRVAVQGMQPEEKGFAAFRLGKGTGSLSLIRTILDAGADVKLLATPGFSGLVDDEGKKNALDFEINNAKREEVVELLLSRGSNPNGLKIHTTIKYNDETNLKRLLEYGANPGEWDDYNCSAIYRAAERDNGTMIKLLLHHGASPQDSVSYDTSEALERACIMGHINAIKALLAAGATTRYPGGTGVWRKKSSLRPEVEALIEAHGGFRKRKSR